MNSFIWATVLLLIGLALMVLELFLPMAGTLGVLSGVSVIASVFIVFYYAGLGPGTLYLMGVTVVIGVALAKGLRWWPHTRLGRRILNLPPSGDADPESSLDRLDFLVGRIGLTKSKMLPSGMIHVDGETYDAVSTGGPLGEGEAIQVVDVQGNRILIHPHAVGPQEIATDETGTKTSPPDVDLLFPDPFDESSNDERLP